MSKSRVAIRETYSLPSRGLVYGESIPDKVTIRAMTTKEEKQRLAGIGLYVIPDIIKACIVEPDNIDVYNMKLFDINYLMYKIRIVTYGPMYDLTLRCAHCGHIFNTSINLDDLPVKEVEDNFKEPFMTSPLPVSKDVIEFKLFSVNDLAHISRESKRMASKFPDYELNPEDIVTLMQKVETVNGEKLNDIDLRTYLEDMNARDLLVFETEYNKIDNNLGLDRQIVEICPNCQEDVSTLIPITDEFFRPKY